MRMAVALILFFAVFSAQAQSDAKFDQCRKKLVAAQKLDLLYAMDWKPPKEPYVVAGPTFYSLRIDGKIGFAETLNCFLVGGEDSYVNFDILDSRSGNPVARWSNGRLTVR